MSREHQTLNGLFNDTAYAIGEKVGKTVEQSVYNYPIPVKGTTGQIKSFGGKSLVLNQLVQNGNFADGSANWDAYLSTITVLNNEAKVVIHAGVSAGQVSQQIPPIAGHKCFVSVELKNDVDNPVTVQIHYGIGASYNTWGVPTTSWEKKSVILTPQSDSKSIISYVSNGVEGETYHIRNIRIIDLTQMFGAGNEPTTVEEVEAIIGTDYIPYNEGELVNAVVDSVDSVGKNLLDLSGATNVHQVLNGITFDYNKDSGEMSIKGTATATVYINWNLGKKVLEGDYGEYYIHLNNTGTTTNNASFSLLNYEQTRQVFFCAPSQINRILKLSEQSSFVPDENIGCLRLYVLSGATVDITCKPSIERGSAPTTYSPYFHESKTIPSAVKALPLYGASAGNVYNEIDWVNKKYIQRVGSVDLGTLTWNNPGGYFSSTTSLPNVKTPAGPLERINAICSKYTPTQYDGRQDKDLTIIFSGSTFEGQVWIIDSDYTSSSDFKTAMSGVMFYYELAEPIITDISELLTTHELIKVEGGGTLTFTQEDYHIPVPFKGWTNGGVVDLNEYVADDFPGIIESIPQPVGTSKLVEATPPTGKKEITSTAEVDVASYATAQVVDSNLIAENIKQGVSVLGVTGTLSSKNAQSSPHSKRITSTTLTETGASITVAKTGTYNISWMCAAQAEGSTTYNYSSRAYVDGTAIGSNHYAAAISDTATDAHIVSESNVSLTEGQVIDVRARSRGSSYYIIAGMLAIEEV